MRQLTLHERHVLEAVLGGDFAGAAELRDQLKRTRVVGGKPTFLDLDVVRVGADASPIRDGPVPVRALVGSEGAEVGELLVWVEGGYLSALEFAWVTDVMPDRLPAPDEIRLIS